VELDGAKSASSHRAVAPEDAAGFADVKPGSARISGRNRAEISGEYGGAMDLDEFNTADAGAAASVVGVWAAIPAWVDAVVAGRPYASVDALTARAAALADEWTVADLDTALARHPRIGQRPVGAGAEAAASRREQSAMTDAAADIAAAIAAGNAAYEERFGRVFLVRAAGRSPEAILAELRRRLGSDEATEAGESLSQLAEIALLRLRGAVTESYGAGPPGAASSRARTDEERIA
jgi:2-oxo-4-hydroxy-4-carboxy-5-ureidoimidazoline decarboxylase